MTRHPEGQPSGQPTTAVAPRGQGLADARGPAGSAGPAGAAESAGSVPAAGAAAHGPRSTGIAATERTAEIPVVRGPGPLPRRPVELADGTLWYPGVSPRLPAPFGLRLAVWLLLFVLLVAAGGLVVEHVRPRWVAFLRSVAPSAAPKSPRSARTPSRAAHGGLRLRSATASQATYDVGASSFSLVISVTAPCWTGVTSPAGSASYVLAETLTPATGQRVVAVHGSASARFGASSATLAVTSAGRTLGRISSPKVGVTYTFLATP